MGLCVGLDQRFVRWVAEKKKGSRAGVRARDLLHALCALPSLITRPGDGSDSRTSDGHITRLLSPPVKKKHIYMDVAAVLQSSPR